MLGITAGRPALELRGLEVRYIAHPVGGSGEPVVVFKDGTRLIGRLAADDLAPPPLQAGRRYRLLLIEED